MLATLKLRSNYMYVRNGTDAVQNMYIMFALNIFFSVRAYIKPRCIMHHATKIMVERAISTSLQFWQMQMQYYNDISNPAKTEY